MSVAPVKLTVLPAPTVAVPKLAVPPVRLTLAVSAASTPLSVRDSTVALVVPS